MDPERLERLFWNALAQDDPGLELRVAGHGRYPDTFEARLQAEPVQVTWLSVGWPRQVRDVLARPDRPDLVAANELSPGARKLLNEAELSWFDGTGDARIALPGLRIRIEVNRSPGKPARRNLGWKPATLAVCEALLTGSGGSVSVTAERTGLALSTVASSLRFLQEDGLLDAEASRGRNARRSIVDADQLLDAYAAAAARLRSPESIRVGVLWREPIRGTSELGSKWAKHDIAWAATGAIAADVMAPLLTDVAPMEIYVGGAGRAELRQIAGVAGLKESSGGRLVLRPFPTPAKDALTSRWGPIRVMTWPRVYADLRTTGVRGEEAAEHLREQLGAAL